MKTIVLIISLMVSNVAKSDDVAPVRVPNKPYSSPYRVPNNHDSKTVFQQEMVKVIDAVNQARLDGTTQIIKIYDENVPIPVDQAFRETPSQYLTQEIITNPVMWTVYTSFREGILASDALRTHLSPFFSLNSNIKSFWMAAATEAIFKTEKKFMQRYWPASYGDVTSGVVIEFFKQLSLAALKKRMGGDDNWEYITASWGVDQAFALISAAVQAKGIKGAYLPALIYEEANITIDRTAQLYSTAITLEDEKFRALSSATNGQLIAARGVYDCQIRMWNGSINNCLPKARELLSSAFQSLDSLPEWSEQLVMPMLYLIYAKKSYTLRQMGATKLPARTSNELISMADEEVIRLAEDYTSWNATRVDMLKNYAFLKESFLTVGQINEAGGISCNIGKYSICK